MPKRKEAWSWPGYAAVFAAALLIRCVYLGQIYDAPFFGLRLGDAEAYHSWAQRIAAGDWLGSGVFYQAPLYPYFLAVVYCVSGDGVLTVRLVQAVLGAASCTFLAAAGVQLFGRRGVLTGWMLAVCPAAIFFDALLEKTALATFLGTALLSLLAVPRESITPRRCLGAGIILGLLALTRENALILCLPITALLVFRSARTRACRVETSGTDPQTGHLDAWRISAVFAAGCVAVLLPVALRNQVVGGEFHLTTSQFGPNFYIGNHPGASGYYEALVVGHGNASDEREDAERLAETAAGRKLSAGEVSQYWSHRATSYIAQHPLDWLKLTARKFALTLNAAEASDTESLEVYAGQSWLLWILRPFDFGVVLGLAALGAVLTAGSWRRMWVFYAMACAYEASLVMFYVLGRYRFPLAPLLMLPAAGGILALRGASRRKLMFGAFAFVAAAAFAHIPLYDSRIARATHYAGIAAALSKEPNGLDVAMTYYQRAIDADARFPAAQYGMGTMLARSGRDEEAIPYYRAALALWPDYQEAHYNLAMALTATGQGAAGMGQFREALRLRPDDADSHFGMGKLLLAEDPAASVEQYRQGLAARPKDVAGLVGLGVALTQAGRPDEAIAQYRVALALDPRNAAAHNNLGWTLATQGHIAEAIPYFERALELMPDYQNARMNLEQARKMTGRSN